MRNLLLLTLTATTMYGCGLPSCPPVDDAILVATGDTCSFTVTSIFQPDPERDISYSVDVLTPNSTLLLTDVTTGDTSVSSSVGLRAVGVEDVMIQIAPCNNFVDLSVDKVDATGEISWRETSYISEEEPCIWRLDTIPE